MLSCAHPQLHACNKWLCPFKASTRGILREHQCVHDLDHSWCLSCSIFIRGTFVQHACTKSHAEKVAIYGEPWDVAALEEDRGMLLHICTCTHTPHACTHTRALHTHVHTTHTRACMHAHDVHIHTCMHIIRTRVHAHNTYMCTHHIHI